MLGRIKYTGRDGVIRSVPTVRVSDVTVTRARNGALILSTTVNGYLVTRAYYDYTRRESLRMFRALVALHGYALV
jgi:hypothetical protein